jgi:hypothetical protein
VPLLANAHAFSQRFESQLKTGQRRTDGSRANLTNTGLFMRNTGIDQWRNPRFDHAANIESQTSPGNPSQDLQLHIALQIDFRHLLGHRFRRFHSTSPDKRVTPGAAIIAAPPMPNVSVMALSPISGLACSCEKPVKNSPCGVLTGAVNQRSPSPLT